jgi:hypothetical protein
VDTMSLTAVSLTTTKFLAELTDERRRCYANFVTTRLLKKAAPHQRGHDE